jgi:hypothetical protein
VENIAAPQAMVAPRGRTLPLLARVRNGLPCARDRIAAACTGANGDLAVSLETAERRARTAFLAAAGILVEATAPRELVAVDDTVPVTVNVYNQGKNDVVLNGVSVWANDDVASTPSGQRVDIPPDSAGRATVTIRPPVASQPWWMAVGRRGDMFIPAGSGSTAAENIAIGEDRIFDTRAQASLTIAGTPVAVTVAPVIYRVADPARGELRKPLAAVPAISVLFDDEVEYARAGAPFERAYTVHLRSASSSPSSVSVKLTPPAGLTGDSLVRHAALPPFGSTSIVYRLRGRLAAGRHAVHASASVGDHVYEVGYLPVQYSHIRPLRYYRAASVEIEAVNAALPARTNVAYVQGVGDNVAPMLAQLGLNVTPLSPEQLAVGDLSSYSAIVVGPRAFAASPTLAAHAARLQEFARGGGTVVVQYGQQEMQVPGLLPYPITLARVAQRVTDENAAVAVLDPASRLLAFPNRITGEDFKGWVQERATYMPTTADPHYQRLFEMHDPSEPPNENAVLVAPMGRGAYVYVTLALFRQLPAGVPGGARLFLNLLAANGQSTASALPQP